MRLARPSVAEERALALAARYPEVRGAARELAGPWRCATPLTRTLSFVLGLALAGFSRTVLDLIDLPWHDLLCGLMLIAVAEWLITRRHFHASGVEEALWASGTALVVLELLDGFSNFADAAAFLVMAGVAALAGWRLINPLFTTLAAVFASLAVMSLSGLSLRRTELASLASFAGAFIALGAGALRMKRPGIDRMLDGLVVALPVIAYLWSLWSSNRPPTLALLQAGQWSVLWAAALLFTYAVAAVITGLARRRHAPLVAALTCLPLLAFELRAIVAFAEHWQFMLWGVAGLAAAILIERAHRVPRAGVTSRNIATADEVMDMLQLGAAVIVTPAAGTTAAASTAVQGQGGEFGGGGASGKF